MTAAGFAGSAGPAGEGSDAPWVPLAVPFRDRRLFWLVDSAPAVFLLDDPDAGGVLINAPAWSSAQLQAISVLAVPRFLFLPSRFGARDLERWRQAGLEVLASRDEFAGPGGQPGSAATVDLPLDGRRKLTRWIDLLPLAGRTSGTRILRIKARPETLFHGPALQAGADGWPALVPSADDVSWENRLIGGLGLKDLHFEFAFGDDFRGPHTSPAGPGAWRHYQRHLEALLGT